MKKGYVEIFFNGFFAFVFYFTAISIFFDNNANMTDFFHLIIAANTFLILIKLEQTRIKKGGEE